MSSLLESIRNTLYCGIIDYFIYFIVDLYVKRKLVISSTYHERCGIWKRMCVYLSAISIVVAFVHHTPYVLWLLILLTALSIPLQLCDRGNIPVAFDRLRNRLRCIIRSLCTPKLDTKSEFTKSGFTNGHGNGRPVGQESARINYGFYPSNELWMTAPIGTGDQLNSLSRRPLHTTTVITNGQMNGESAGVEESTNPPSPDCSWIPPHRLPTCFTSTPVDSFRQKHLVFDRSRC